jgi:hypothetical protein
MNNLSEQSAALVTCSYGPDLNRCARLCRSIERWVSPTIPHVIIVPARDLPDFRQLQGQRRTVVAVEDVVPGRFRQLPFTRRWWLDSGGWPVRGWIMQQVTKLSANFATDAELIVFADSDLQFVRPLEPHQLLRNGALRLHRIPGAKDEGRHRLWHHRAAALLGEQLRYFGADYVGQLISWRRSNLGLLQEHLEAVGGRPWYQSVARSLHFSEYVLYGAYVDGVLGLDSSGHFGTAEDICHCCWFAEEAQALGSGRDTLRDNAVAVLLQSNLGLSEAAEADILSRIRPDRALAATGA